MAKRGAPTIYSEELVDAICELVADGASLRAIGATEGMPATNTLVRWLADGEHPYFKLHYARAKEALADKFSEEILQISDDGSNDTYIDENGNRKTDQDVIARSRLRVDSRKWLASKLAPKKYGDKLDLSSSDGTMTPASKGMSEFYKSADVPVKPPAS